MNSNFFHFQQYKEKITCCLKWLNAEIICCVVVDTQSSVWGGEPLKMKKKSPNSALQMALDTCQNDMHASKQGDKQHQLS